ncbi:hypothetical protein HZS_2002 [Henneguya salminicola]|nr:hypothetical protein HZS_2002 [Henneguya salminicola]
MELFENTLKIFEDPIKGKGLKAPRSIKQGEEIFQELGFSACVYRDFVQNVCAYCLVHCDNITTKMFPLDFFACKECNKVFYCSNKCQLDDIGIHKIECKWLSNYNGIPTVTARLIARILIKERTSTVWQTNKLFAGNCNNISSEDHEISRKTLIEINLYVSKTYISSSDQLSRLLQAINLNGVIINSYDCSQIGVGIYPNFSLINHSCNPNSSRVFLTGNILRVYALNNIKIDDEITIAYIDIAYPTTLRQHALSAYQMNCQCNMCMSSEESLMQCFELNQNSLIVIENIQNIEKNFAGLNFTTCEEKAYAKFSALELKLSALFPPSNIVWISFYKALSSLIQICLSFEHFLKYSTKILDEVKRIYGLYSVNYFDESLFYCIKLIFLKGWVSLQQDRLRLPSSYYRDFLIVAKSLYGPDDKIIYFLNTIFKSVIM